MYIKYLLEIFGSYDRRFDPILRSSSVFRSVYTIELDKIYIYMENIPINI